MAIRFDGLDKVIDRFDDMTDEYVIQEGLEKACLRVEREARKRAPKMSGELRRQMAHRVEGLTGTVFNPLWYAPYVEWGTGKYSEHPKGGRKDVPWGYIDEKTGELVFTYGQHAKPFLRTTIKDLEEQIIADIRREVFKRR